MNQRTKRYANNTTLITELSKSLIILDRDVICAATCQETCQLRWLPMQMMGDIKYNRWYMWWQACSCVTKQSIRSKAEQV